MLKAPLAKSKPDVKRIEEEAKAQIDEAIAFAEASPFPAPGDTLKGLWVE